MNKIWKGIRNLWDHLFGGKRTAFRRIREDTGRARLISADFSRDRYIIFSDLHKGDRTGSDPFREAADWYRQALNHYFANGFTLVLLGDLEEGWGYEGRMAKILSAYHDDIIEAERKFIAAGRYMRLYGNHDDDWRFPERVADVLAPSYRIEGMEVPPAIILQDTASGEKFLLIHGCQGGARQDIGDPVARVVMKYGFLTLTGAEQHRSLIKIAKKMARQQQYIFEWARKQGYNVIAGHTHIPYFQSKKIEAPWRDHIAALRIRADLQETAEEKTRLAQEAETIEAVLARFTDFDLTEEFAGAPFYYNDGCCIGRNMLTGIKISDGRIELIGFNQHGEVPLI